MGFVPEDHAACGRRLNRYFACSLNVRRKEWLHRRDFPGPILRPPNQGTRDRKIIEKVGEGAARAAKHAV
jgi:hypothetical protein